MIGWGNVLDVEYLKDIQNIPTAINDQENIDQDTEVEPFTIAETCDNLQLTIA